MVVVAEGSVWSGFSQSEDVVCTVHSDSASLTGASGFLEDSVSVAGDRRTRLARGVPIVAMPVLADPLVAPFSNEACGSNLMLSEDGYRATRRCGCRESVAIGSAPLERQSRGLYFEVEISQTVEGWLGGLGIGVTHTPPGRLARLPDKAWRVPETFVVGYSGSIFLCGAESRTAQWQPDQLVVGQCVGLLITGDGRENLIVFVDGEEVLRVEGADMHAAGLRDAPLFPIVDVFNASLSVQLRPHAVAQPPWGAPSVSQLVPYTD